MRGLKTLGRAIVALVLGLVVLAPLGCDCCTRRSANGLWSALSTEKSSPATSGQTGVVAGQAEKSKTS